MMANENRCVICWAVIPEGRMVCPSCWKKVMKDVPCEGREDAGSAPESGGQEQGRNRPGIVRLLHRLALCIRRRGRGMHAGMAQEPRKAQQ